MNISFYDPIPSIRNSMPIRTNDFIESLLFDVKASYYMLKGVFASWGRIELEIVQVF